MLTPRKSTKKTGSPWPLLGVDTMEKEKTEEEDRQKTRMEDEEAATKREEEEEAARKREEEEAEA